MTPATPAPLPAPPLLHRVPVPLAASEEARYRLTFGVLPVGEASVAIDGDDTVRDHATLHARGHAAGSFAGFGRFDKTIDVGFDPVALAPRPLSLPVRWLRARREPSPPAPSPATVTSESGQPPPSPARGTARAGSPLVATVSDGKGRWRVTLTNRGSTNLDGDPSTPALKLEGRAEPLPGGARDERVAHAFTLWLAADPTHLPLRLTMPLGVANLGVSLVEVRRTAPSRAANYRELRAATSSMISRSVLKMAPVGDIRARGNSRSHSQSARSRADGGPYPGRSPVAGDRTQGRLDALEAHPRT